MKTTIEISDELLRRAKQAALDRDTTLRAIIEEALARALGPATPDVAALRTVTWPRGPAGRKRGIAPEAVEAAITREREGPPGDPEYWRKRMGFVPPGVRRK